MLSVVGARGKADKPNKDMSETLVVGVRSIIGSEMPYNVFFKLSFDARIDSTVSSDSFVLASSISS